MWVAGGGGWGEDPINIIESVGVGWVWGGFRVGWVGLGFGLGKVW